jgi:hypothetical protein
MPTRMSIIHKEPGMDERMGAAAVKASQAQIEHTMRRATSHIGR